MPARSLLTQSQFIKQAKWIKDTKLAFSVIKKKIKMVAGFLGLEAQSRTTKVTPALSKIAQLLEVLQPWMCRSPFSVNRSVWTTCFAKPWVCIHGKGSPAELRSLWVNNQRLTCGVKPCNWSDTSKAQLAPHPHGETLHGASRADRPWWGWIALTHTHTHI